VDEVWSLAANITTLTVGTITGTLTASGLATFSGGISTTNLTATSQVNTPSLINTVGNMFIVAGAGDLTVHSASTLTIDVSHAVGNSILLTIGTSHQLVFDGTSFSPVGTTLIDLGTSALRYGTLYGTVGNFSGDISALNVNVFGSVIPRAGGSSVGTALAPFDVLYIKDRIDCYNPNTLEIGTSTKGAKLLFMTDQVTGLMYKCSVQSGSWSVTSV